MNEKELKLFEIAMDLAIGECYSGDVEDIKNLEIKIKLIDGLYKAQKEVIDRLNFIKNRKNQGASQENINKMAIEFVNSYLKEVS